MCSFNVKDPILSLLYGLLIQLLGVVCEESLKSCYFSLSPDRINSMLTQLREEVQKIVYDMWS
jgi:hypothetical protein